MTTKADAHFVDCDLATGSGSWSQSPVRAIQHDLVAHARAVQNEGLAVTDSAGQLAWKVTPSASVTYSADIDEDGYVIASAINNAMPLILFDIDGVDQSVAFDWPQGDSIAANSINEVRFSPDATHIYMLFESTTNKQMLYKYHRNGTFVWKSQMADTDGKTIAVDASGYIYYCPAQGIVGNSPPVRINPDTGVDDVTYSNRIYLNEASCIDNSAGYAYFGGTGATWTSQTLVLGLSLDGTSSIYYREGSASKIHSICANGESVYVLGTGDIYNTNNVVKLNAQTLAVEARASVSFAASIWMNWDGNLAVSVADGSLDFVKVIDKDDLSLVENYATNNSWKPVLISGESKAFSGTLSAPGLVLSSQDRTVAFPQDYAHLEGQTVQVLKDGVYIGDDTVSGGQITLDD